MKLPCSAALPFGAFEAVLLQPENATAATAVEGVSQQQQPAQQQLEGVRAAIQDLQAPPQLQDQIKAAFEQSGEASAHGILAKLNA